MVAVGGVAKGRPLVVIAATLNQFNIPEAGLLLILGVDTFLDMGRSATNVVGNSVATAVVAKWEGELKPERASWPAITARSQPSGWIAAANQFLLGGNANTDPLDLTAMPGGVSNTTHGEAVRRSGAC